MAVATEVMVGTGGRGAPGPGVLRAIVVAGVAASGASVGLALESDHVSDPVVQSGLIDWITLPYIVSGVVAWWRRPESRLGPLMVAAGFVTFLSTLQWTSSDVPFTVGQTLDLVPVALFVHVFLAFPSGRLQRRFEAWLVAATYALAIGLELVGMAIGGFGPHNLLEVTSRPGAARTLERVPLPVAGSGRTMTLIDRDGTRLAALLHDAGLEEERELLAAVGAAAGIALENGRLQAEQQAHLAELKGSRARVIEAGQRERQRLERNLHDGAQQRLIALSLELSLLEKQVAGDADARARLDQARREIAVALDELRAVARGLHPAVLSGHGLEVALQSIVANAPVSVRLNVSLTSRLPEQIEVAAYYVVSESLANLGKHARAKSASIDVSRVDGLAVLEVVDDGVGGAETEHGSGLRGLADRVEALGGTLRVWSPAGGGTRLRAEMPCA